MAVLIYTTKLRPEPVSLPHRWLAELPAGKREALLRSQPVRRQESAAGLQLLAYGMRHLGDTEFKLQDVRFEKGLKPTVPHGIHFSISHSDGIAACALNATRDLSVGLDIEALRPLDEGTLAAYMTPGEGSLLEQWTRRESVVKAAGWAGLAHLRDVEYHAPLAFFGGRTWLLQRVDLGQAFVAHLATQAVPSDPLCGPGVTVTEVPWSELSRDESSAAQPAQ